MPAKTSALSTPQVPPFGCARNAEVRRAGSVIDIHHEAPRSPARRGRSQPPSRLHAEEVAAMTAPDEIRQHASRSSMPAAALPATLLQRVERSIAAISAPTSRYLGTMAGGS
jgi:hypothetical protein